MVTKIPRTAGGWGAVLYSLKMARRAGGLWTILKALFSKNTCKTCALGIGGQKGRLRNEEKRSPEICYKSFQVQVADMEGTLPADFFDRYDLKELEEWNLR